MYAGVPTVDLGCESNTADCKGQAQTAHVMSTAGKEEGHRALPAAPAPAALLLR